MMIINGNKKGGFYRISGISDDTVNLAADFYTQAKRLGRIFEKRLDSPCAADVSAVDTSGAFELSENYLKRLITANIPVQGSAADNMTAGFMRVLSDLKDGGKNDNILKNTAIKHICLIRKYFNGLTDSGISPKIFYAASLTNTEVQLFYILSICGFEILAAEIQGAAASVSPRNRAYSRCLDGENAAPFPDGFLRLVKEKAEQSERLRGLTENGSPPVISNVWISGSILEDIVKSPAERGGTEGLYNLFVRINGAEDITGYAAALYKMYAKLKGSRRILIINGGMEVPSNSEIAMVERGNFPDIYTMLDRLSRNIVHSSVVLQGIMRSAFAQVMLEYYEKTSSLNKTLSKAVYMICWLRRVQYQLFSGWKAPEISCVIRMGGCVHKSEALFMKMLARTPADVLILAPDLSKRCILTDDRLYERNFTNSLTLDTFPTDDSVLSAGTTAFYAERELDSMIYSDDSTAFYRRYQFDRANAIRLKTAYEEIALLWSEDIKYRPGFAAQGDTVSIPVIMAKVSGVRNDSAEDYRNDICGLVFEGVTVIGNSPVVSEYVTPRQVLPLISGGMPDSERILASELFKGSFMVEARQRFFLEKVNLLISKSIIKGADAAAVLAAALSIDTALLRQVQSFDFTEKNPKLIYVNTTENVISAQDSIILALLSLLGFDVVMFLPTGYTSAEKYYAKGFMEEHRIGRYMFDMKMPDFSRCRKRKKDSLLGRLFGK